MVLKWIRGREDTGGMFTRPNVWFTVGARGSGKSSFLEYVATEYLDRGSAVLDLFACYDEETEVFTRHGWTRFRDIDWEDEIATLDAVGYMEYHKPTNIQRYPFKGDMIRFGGGRCGYDLLVTPNHNMLVVDSRGRRVFKKARELLDYARTHSARTIPYSLVRAAKWKGSSDRENVTQIMRAEVFTEPYDGMVYDVTVPNHTLLVRRNGRVAWSGNSRDGENLAWLRSPYAKTKRILLLHGNSINVEAPCDAKPASKLVLGDFERYDIVISSSPLYGSPDEEFTRAGEILDRIYKRLAWNRIVFTLVREASNLYYSRLKLSDSQVQAKSQTVYEVRESRHLGLSMGLDTLRSMSIDVDLRSLADYQILKAQGVSGLSRDLSWLYRYLQPWSVQQMRPQSFVLVTRRGSVALGRFPFPRWHKLEGQAILGQVGVKVTEGDAPPEQGVDKGTFRTVGDEEHAKMIGMYLSGIGTTRISTELRRSSRTPLLQIDAHDSAVARGGYCPACRRAKGEYAEQKVKRVAHDDD
jgi:hypothetical protein